MVTGRSQYKHSVVLDSIGENVTHTSDSFEKLRGSWKKTLSELDLSGGRVLSKCMICDDNNIKHFFEIWGIPYHRCGACSSIFINPRPSDEIYSKAFSNALITEFVSSDEYRKQTKKKFERFIQPLVEPIFYYLNQKRLTVLEIGGRNESLIESLVNKDSVNKIIRYRPKVGYESEKIETVDDFADILDKSCDIALGLQCFESIPNPVDIFSGIAQKVKKGGNILILARAGSGFDIQLLKGKNDTIIPFEHMNLISVEGFENLCRENSLAIKEMSTPGLLDINYIKQKLGDFDNLEFMRYLFDNRSEDVINSFQKFLQMARLSSSLRLICSPEQ